MWFVVYITKNQNGLLCLAQLLQNLPVQVTTILLCSSKELFGLQDFVLNCIKYAMK